MNIPKSFIKQIFNLAFLALLGFASIQFAAAQTSGVDSTFNAMPSKEITGAPNFRLQPDGKILVFGGTITRLNSDGSTDNTFNCTACNFYIGSVLIQPDGKIVVGGSYSIVGASVARVARLNSDGSIDPTFASPYGEPVQQVNSSVTLEAIQPDGKILVFGSSSSSGIVSYGLRRLNTDGSFDTSFTTIDYGFGRSFFFSIGRLYVFADGKFLIAGSGGSSGGVFGSLRRYNANGTVDSSFEQPSFTGTAGGFGNGTIISSFDIQSDGAIVVGGSFTAINGVERINLARILPAGNVDLSFAPPNVYVANESINRVKIVAGGKILVSTGSGLFQGSGNRFFRFNADGSLDNTFVSPSNLTVVGYWDTDAAGRIVLSGGFNENGTTVYKIVRLNPNGDYDNSFSTEIRSPSSVSALSVQADNKVIIYGDFTRIGSVSRPNFARLNADGSVDQSFNPGTAFGSATEIRKILVQSDGKILVIGNFTTYNGTARVQIVRINNDGSVDANFNPVVDSSINALALQPDGKILIGGTFSNVNGAARTGIARLNSDGTLDASFNPIIGSPTINTVVVQSDGKIIVGGSFNGVNGFSRTGIVRLNADGTLDSSFNAGNASGVAQIEIQSDGKYVVLTVGGNLYRLNNNGTSDATFQTLTAGISSILAQPDGSVIVVGNFTGLRGVSRQGIARLKPDGTVDLSFLPNGANGSVLTIARQADGKVLVGGTFTIIGNVMRVGVARLNVSPYHLITLFDFDGDGRADVSVFRPSNGYWYELRSQTGGFYAQQFGQAGDLIAPADYDGDGKTDIAVWRGVVPGAGNFAYFYIYRSSDNTFLPVQFGATNDVPMSGDWDGDGKADLAVYRDGSQTGGQSYFYYRPSAQPGVNFISIAWGGAGDKPLYGDFDGDGKLDAAIYRASTTQWYILRSSNNQPSVTTFGTSGDIPVPADYDGDGLTNIAVFRPSTGYWYTSTNPATNYGAVPFGASGDLPVPADYDGDGKADVAVFRPSSGAWYLNRSTAGFTGVAFGDSNDKPTPNAFIR